MVHKTTLIFCIMVLVCSQMVFSAGVSPGKTTINFFPNEKISIEYTISGYPAGFYLSDVGCDFVSFNNDTQKSSTGEIKFSVTLNFPEKMEPGTHSCGFMVKHGELSRDLPPYAGGGVGALAEVGAVILVNVPAKGKYAEISFEANNANQGEPVYFKVAVSNLGEIDLYGLSAVIDVMDIEGNVKETIHTTTADAPRFGTAELWKRMETTNYESARYKAKAVLLYGGEKPAEAETEFLIGKLFVNFLGINTEASSGRINPVTVDVESWWGNPIENVRAEVSVYNQSNVFKGDFRTESTDLAPWQKATLQGYWDASGLEPGNYTAEIALKYKGGETKAEAMLVLNEAGAIEEKEEQGFDKIKEVLTSPIFLAILVLILIINVGVWLLKQRKTKESSETKTTEAESKKNRKK